MKITRRAFVLTSLVASTAKMLGQGVASRTVKAQTKPAPSGRPFDAHFVDVAQEAGLTFPVIYGDPDNKDYILALSPHHRFVIALHSPDKVAETGLRRCPPEKCR